MAEEQNEELSIISKHDFYFETPLYDVLSLEGVEDELFSNDVDAYSAKNNTDTTYRINIKSINVWDVWENSQHNEVGFYLVTLTCKRKDNDIIRFIIFRNTKILFKVGQFPSIADLQFEEIGKKYDKILSKQNLHDLKKAIGLMAHGAGAGSLVYLRRIFENIIFETFASKSNELKISEQEFKSKKMDEKVGLLKNYLPSQLLEMNAIYGILSKGVHELSEEECLTYFPALKLSILLILDEKNERLEKDKKDAATRKAIFDISQQIKGKK